MQKLKKLLILSFKNLKCHKWLNAKIASVLAFLMFILSLFSVVGISISLMRRTLYEQSASANYLYSFNPNPQSKDKTFPEGTQVIEYKDAGRSQRMIDKRKELFGEEATSELFYLSTSTVGIEMDGKIFTSNAGDWFSGLPFSLNLMACQNPFTDNDYIELKSRFGLDNFIIGAMPQAADEVVVSATLLDFYNISYKNVLGKQLTFHLEDWGAMWDPFTVTGVIIPEYTELRGHIPAGYLFSENFRPDIIVADDSEAVWGTVTYLYSFTRLLTYDEIDYLIERFEFGLGGSYIGYSTLREAEHLGYIQTITTNLFVILGVSFGVGLLLIIYLLTDRFIKYFVRGGGVLLTEGIEGRELNVLTLMQVLILCGIAVLASFVLTTAIYAVARVILNRYIFWWAELIAINGTYFLILFGVGFAMVLAVTLLLLLNIFILMRKKSIKELLNTTAD